MGDKFIYHELRPIVGGDGLDIPFRRQKVLYDVLRHVLRLVFTGNVVRII